VSHCHYTKWQEGQQNMQVIYANERLKHIQIDAARTKQFLLAQGMDEKKIDLLRMHVQYAPSQQRQRNMMAQGDGNDAWGLYCGPRDIYLFTNRRPRPMASSLNETAFHELRHHIKNGYRPGEIKLPHKDRPSEIDAYAFAAEHAPSHALVSVTGEWPLSMEETMLQILAVELVVCGLLGACVLLRWLNKQASRQCVWKFLWNGVGR
jgi:hypothetical protein